MSLFHDETEDDALIEARDALNRRFPPAASTGTGHYVAVLMEVAKLKCEVARLQAVLVKIADARCNCGCRVMAQEALAVAKVSGRD